VRVLRVLLHVPWHQAQRRPHPVFFLAAERGAQVRAWQPAHAPRSRSLARDAPAVLASATSRFALQDRKSLLAGAAVGQKVYE
jgi:hypothetical protein